MSKAKNQNERLKTVGETVSKFEKFLEKNNKAIIIAGGAIVVIIIGIMLYNNFIRKPKRIEAADSLFKAEEYFEKDSFKLALNGDGAFPGFLDIIDDYGSTPSGKLANYYAGVCYMRLGEYQNAIDFLKSYSSDDPMVGPMALCLIGDANMELGNHKEALSYYKKAADKANNDLLSPSFLKKAAQTCEILEDYKQALSLYQRIEKDFYGSSEQRDIEKYIERVKILSEE